MNVSTMPPSGSILAPSAMLTKFKGGIKNGPSNTSDLGDAEEGKRFGFFFGIVKEFQ